MARNLVYARRRVSPFGGAFVEFFLTPNESGHFDLPVAPVARFEGRVSNVVVVPHQYEIRATSSTWTGLQKRTRPDLFKDGFWATYHDVVPKGGPIGPSLAVIYGVPVSPGLYQNLYHGIKVIYEGLKTTWPDVDLVNDPWVVYHGTAKTNIGSIAKSGLRPSFGMLGTAVYFGTFWKAWRFATMTHTYEKRPGAIYRVLGFWNGRMHYRTQACEPCLCARCPRGTPLADHEARWAHVWQKKAVWAIPYAGGPIKNEEYACADSTTFVLDSYAYANATTDHHEPLSRDQVVL